MTDRAERAVRNLIESWSDRDQADVGAFLSDDAVFHNGPRGIYHGRDTVRALFQRNLATPTWFGVDIHKVVSDGHTVMVERTDKMVLDGKQIGMELVGVFDVDDEGRITRWREYYDFQSFQEDLAAAGIATRAPTERFDGDLL
jgi:limonene-1,2-epoxide hydrolase